MKVRCLTLWVAIAAIVTMVAIATGPACAVESKAIEVTPDTVENTTAATAGADDEAEATVAREIPLTENSSLRTVGSAAQTGAADTAAGTVAFDADPAATPGTQPPPSDRFMSLDDLRHEVSSLDSRTLYLGTNPTFHSAGNQAYAGAFNVYPHRAAMGYTPFGTPTRIDPQQPRWQVSGSIGAAAGSATYADNDTFEFSLRESLTTLSNDHYEFYQEYGIDNSYVESSTLTIGARQRFRDWAAGGDLRLTEEFQLYENHDNSAYDRQDGLFALRFDPQWLAGRVQANINYQYRIRLYDDFSTRSYKHNSVRTDVRYRFSPLVSTTGRLRFDDYNYSLGSTRSNNRWSAGNEWEWQAGPDVLLSAGVSREEKTYNLTKTRNYEKLEYEAGVQWKPDDSSHLKITGELADYQRENDPAADYDDQRLTARYRRDLCENLDVEVRTGLRSKEYDLAPDNDLDISEAGVRFNYHAGYAWNWYAGFEQADYDYATLTRRFTRTTADAGAGYRCGPLRTAVDYRHRENSYDTNAAFDYTRDDLDFSLAYRLDRNRWRLYYGVSLLDQTALNSYNDYTETRLGAGWDVDLDADTRLKLSYDYSERDYDVFSDNDYSRLGATIEFDL